MSQEDWKDIPDCIGTIHASNPLLEGWMLVSAPDHPFLNAYKNRIIVSSTSDDSVNSNSVPQNSGTPNNSVPHNSVHQDSVQNTSVQNTSDRNTSDLDYAAPEDSAALDSNASDYEEPFSDEILVQVFGNKTSTPQVQKDTANSSTTASTENHPPAVEKRKRTLPNLSSQQKTPMWTLPSKPKRSLPTMSTSQFRPTNSATAPTEISSSSFSTTTDSQKPRRKLPRLSTNNIQPKPTVINYTLESIKLYEALSDEQKNVYNVVMDGKSNVFFTGSAGTGKSVLLRALISKFRTLLANDEIAVTASTGIAAVNIQGTTIHSFAHVQHGEKQAEEYIEKIKKRSEKVKALNKFRVLIVDEISMLDGALLDKIEFICRRIRNNMTKPFGGIQVIFCGDFFQLPPINRNGSSLMAFEASCWNRVIDQSFVLKTTFRQTDSDFIKILNEIRHGYVSENSERILNSLSRTPHLEVDIEQTELYSLRTQVDYANKNKLDRLPGEEYRFEGVDFAKPYYENSLKTIMAPKTLILKEGAQVMLIKNLSPTLVNGSIGKVIGFEEESDDVKPIVQFINGERRAMGTEEWTIDIQGNRVASRVQIPLMLAWAISIHKSQGQTIPYVKVNLNNSFEQGQVYVALSRATSMNTLQVLNFRKDAVKVHPRVSEFYKRIN